MTNRQPHIAGYSELHKRYGGIKTLRGSLLALISVALVLGACGGDDAGSSDSTTTQMPATTTSLRLTTTTALATTTTVSAAANVATAEAMIAAIFANDDDALGAMPWASTTPEDATSARVYSGAINVELLDVSCVATDARLVTCQVRTSDDLVIAIGADSSNKTFLVTLDDSGQITTLVDDSDDDQAVEVFREWAFETYPDICDSPAQCALALLDVADEYLESELP